MWGDRFSGARVLLALAVVIGALSLTAAMSGSPATSPDDPTVANLSAPDIRSLVAAVLLVLSLLGFVLLIVSAILIQRGAGTTERPKRSIVSALIFVAAAAAMARWLPRNEGAATDEAGPTGDRSGTTTEVPLEAGSQVPLGPATIGLIVLVLLIAAGVVVLLARRPDDVADAATEEQQRREVIENLTVTIDDLLAEPDPRRAVLMAHQRLESTFAQRGVERSPSRTPGEFLTVALAHLSVSSTEATRLTGLFDRAMFSPNSIDRSMQEEAAASLRAVRDELAGNDRSGQAEAGRRS